MEMRVAISFDLGLKVQIVATITCIATLLISGCAADERDTAIDWSAPAAKPSSGNSATGGTANSNTGTPGSSSPNQHWNPPAPVAGRWALLFKYLSDGIGVDLTQDGQQLTGTGCSWGWQKGGLANPDAFCGEITNGSVDGQRVQFTFRFYPPAVSYQVTAFASAQEDRMTGTVTVMGEVIAPSAWLPIDNTAAFVPLNTMPTWVDVMQWPNHQKIDLELLEDRGGIAEFTADHGFEVWREWGIISGDLGYFTEDEMRVDVDGQATGTVTAGPVSQTEPHLPNQLLLHVEAGMLRTVEASTPAGGDYLFGAKPTSP
jgi:hypothetical protein